MTLGMVTCFLDKIPRKHSMKEIIDKFKFIKIKNVLWSIMSRESEKRQYTVRKFLQKTHLLSKMNKERTLKIQQ